VETRRSEMTPVLYGPDGRTPIAFDVKDDEPRMIDKAILIEFFGTLMCYQQQHEWPTLPGGLNEGIGKMLDVIVDRVGPEAINQRYARYGCRVGLVPNTDAPAPMPERPTEPPPNQYKDHNQDKVLTFPKAGA
jgi:hypothetical protein